MPFVQVKDVSPCWAVLLGPVRAWYVRAHRVPTRLINRGPRFGTHHVGARRRTGPGLLDRTMHRAPLPSISATRLARPTDPRMPISFPPPAAPRSSAPDLTRDSPPGRSATDSPAVEPRRRAGPSNQTRARWSPRPSAASATVTDRPSRQRPEAATANPDSPRTRRSSPAPAAGSPQHRTAAAAGMTVCNHQPGDAGPPPLHDRPLANNRICRCADA